MQLILQVLYGCTSVATDVLPSFHSIHIYGVLMSFLNSHKDFPPLELIYLIYVLFLLIAYDLQEHLRFGLLNSTCFSASESSLNYILYRKEGLLFEDHSQGSDARRKQCIKLCTISYTRC